MGAALLCLEPFLAVIPASPDYSRGATSARNAPDGYSPRGSRGMEVRNFEVAYLELVAQLRYLVSTKPILPPLSWMTDHRNRMEDSANKLLGPISSTSQRAVFDRVSLSSPAERGSGTCPLHGDRPFHNSALLL